MLNPKNNLSLAILLYGLGTGAWCAEAPATKEVRNNVWSMSISTHQHNLKSGDGNHILGASGLVQLGWGYIGDTWLAGTTLDFVTGPFQSPKQQNLVVDFSGTGFSSYIGFSAENQNIRTYDGNYGFLLGISYTDIIGRSVGRRISENEGTIINNWVMRVNNFTLYPSVFFCWMEPARSKGNSPIDLQTRIEGYLLNIGLAAPIQTTYKLKYEEDGISTSTKGNLKGYSVVVTFSALLGV